MRKLLLMSFLVICSTGCLGATASATEYGSPSPELAGDQTVVAVNERTLADERLEQASELKHYRWEWRQENYRLDHQAPQPMAEDANGSDDKN